MAVIVQQAYTHAFSLSIFVAIAFGLYVVYQRYLHPLAGIPGPVSASLSRYWIARLSWVGGSHEVMPRLHQKHGSLVRIGPNELSISDPAAIKQVYSAGSKFRKSDWYSVWQGRRTFDLFPERDEEIHRDQKRLVSRFYAADELKPLERFVDETLQLFFKRLDGLGTKAIDLGRWIQLFAFDVVAELTFSKSFNFLEAGEDDGSFAKIQAALQSAAWVGQVPWLYWLLDFLTPVLGTRLAIANRHGTIRAFAAREVNSRMDRGSDRKDILAKLFEAHGKRPDQLNDNAVVSMATTNIFAGSDTTAISTRAVIYYLLRNEDKKARFLEELRERRAASKLSDPVRLAEANDMPYFQAVILEALRLHPAVGMSLPRVVPRGQDLVVDGRTIPAGTVVGTNPWVIHRNRAVFGEDADQFRPERWLEDGAGDMHRMFFTFGAGSRLCIGKNIGLMEISKLVPTLFLRYDVRLAHPTQEWQLTSWWFVIQEGFHVVLHPWK